MEKTFIACEVAYHENCSATYVYAGKRYTCTCACHKSEFVLSSAWRNGQR